MISSMDAADWRGATEAWVRQPSFEAFRQASYRLSPYAEEASGGPLARLFTARRMADLVTAGHELDALVVRNGRLLSGAPPADVEALRGVLQDGSSLVVRKAERIDEDFAMVADRFGEAVDGMVSVQLYMTPARYHSFGWHYDAEEVVIVQTEGRKEYFLRRNTVNPHPTLETMPENMHWERETSEEVFSCELGPGDWLHIPSGWWHMAKAHRDALSISLGVLHRPAEVRAPGPG